MKTALAVALACAATWACAVGGVERQVLVGRVSRVVDGDTLELTSAGNRVTSIRLAQIDTPEKSQPYGAAATAALSAFVLGQTVRVGVVALDKYGRTVGEVHANDLHVNAEMVRQGHAWAYTRYVESLEIIDFEDEARQHGRGLWGLPREERDPPWVWRQRRRGRRTAPVDRGSADTVCGAKRTCSQMVSCAEARFYLTQCGLTRLDSDADGTPCESICDGM